MLFKQISIKPKYITKQLIILFILFNTGCSIVKSEESAMVYQKDEIIQAARSYVESMGITEVELSDQIDEENTLWNEFVGSAENFWEHNMSIKDKLQGHEYYAVYFHPKASNILGGDLWLFIDKETKEVITYIKGK